MELRDEVMHGVMGFMTSRVTLTAAELDLFTRIDEQPGTVEQIAGRCLLDKEATGRLLDAVAALGFLYKEKDVYRVTERGRLMSSRHEETVLPMVLHFNYLWDTWSQLGSILREGRAGGRKPTTGMNEAAQAAFIGAMHAIGRDLSLEIAAVFDGSPFRRLLDVGGASATYTIAFLRKNPGMRAVLFDVDRVIPLARERLEKEGLLNRVDLVAGDFYRDELPSGCDLALLSAIIHQNSTEENIGLYGKTFRALDPGGCLLVRDHVMDESRTKPPAGALFTVNMLVNTSGGGTYTFEEIRESLEKTGFTGVRWLRKGERMDSLVRARKPA